MKHSKRIIALSIAAALAAPLGAQAAVEVYGQARVSVGFISDDSSATGADDSSIAVTSHNSRLGFKGAEDLGDGLKAVYQIEAQIDMDDDNTSSVSFTDTNTTDTDDGSGATTTTTTTQDTGSGLLIATRNTFVGLAGGFGTVVAGHTDSPYKTSTGKLDIFADSYADYNAVISTTHDIRPDNIIIYTSPDMSGFTLGVGYITDTGNDNLPDTSSTIEKDGFSLAAMYNNKDMGLYATLAYQSLTDWTGTDNEDATAMKLAVGYTLPTKTALGLIYENTEVDMTTGTKSDQDNIYFSVAHPIAEGTNVKLAIGQRGETASGSNNGGDYLALGVSKKMTPNAELYALYAQVSNDASGSGGITAGSGPSAGADKTASAFAVGINLSFSSQ
ncbi:MAG: hypothetical protein A2V90_01745 [Gammaproteobacteria bacterium RBG_16_57_12]|nr:MAG: hypothetical protein A2V90_01745 [Gammaproteobacteria bacterium RBG_16_57_12]